MRSVKPGRGPSMMGGVVAVAAGVFGIFWMTAVIGAGGPPIFAGFGLAFIGIAAANAVYNFRNAASKNRYSVYDIVDEHEEPDPLNERFSRPAADGKEVYAFCPFCGAKLDDGDNFCGKCGKRIGNRT